MCENIIGSSNITIAGDKYMVVVAIVLKPVLHGTAHELAV